MSINSNYVDLMSINTVYRDLLVTNKIWQIAEFYKIAK